MILEKNNLQTTREWSKSYIELIALYVHPKHSNHLRSHLRAIVALDHRRLIRPGKQNQAEFFCVREVYFTKSCQQIWLRVNQPFIPFVLHSWGEQYYEALLLSYRPRTDISQFCNTKYNLHSFNVQDDGSTRGLLAKPFKKFPKPPIRPAVSHFCSESCGRVFELTLIENKETL